MSETEMQATAAAPAAEVKATEAPAPEVTAVSGEPIEAAADGLLVAVGPTVVALLGFCALTLFIVATPIPWFTRAKIPLLGQNNVQQGVFWSKEKSTTTTVTTYVGQLLCDNLRKRLRAVSAFAVISILLAAGLTIAAIAARLGKQTMGAALGLGVATFASSLICWAMGLRVYYQNGLFADSTTTLQCSATSFAAQKFEIGAGEALFITGWVLSALAVVVAKVNPKVPAIVPDAVLDKVGALVFAAFSFVALVCVVIGTPVDIVYVWRTTSMVYRASMWYVYIFTNGDMTAKLKFSKFADAYSCGDIAKYASFAEAFAIIAIAFMLFAFVAGLLFSGGKIGKAAPIVLGLLATVTALVCAAACATIYYRQFCNNLAGLGISTSLQEAGFQLAAGVALFVTAVLVEAVATIILIVIALVQHLKGGAAGGNVKPTAFLFLFGLFISVFFLVLGASQPLISKNTSAVGYERLTWWSLTRRDASGNVADVDFTCQDTWTRLYGGGALVIVSIFLSVVGLLVGVVQLANAGVRKAASVVGLVSSLTQLVAWGLAVTVFTGSFCGVQYYTSGYSIAVGLGLVIASWGLTLAVSVLNLLVAPE